MIEIIDVKKDRKRLDHLLDRNQFEFSEVNDQVKTIVQDVKTNKDQAIRNYTALYDRVDLSTFSVTEEEIDMAFNRLNPLLLEDLRKARDNIARYHEKQSLQSFEYETEDGATLAQVVKPLASVGLYVPGGTARYPSTVLMNAVPAMIAGVKNIVMITPPDAFGKVSDALLVAAKLSGVRTIFKVGGAQGIAALAFGTETIPKVDKIVGPGNIYVSMAKKLVSGYVGIDMIAGPSEILIIADQSANPKYIAADLMGQAEHDPMAAAMLITNDPTLPEKVINELTKQISALERKSIIEQSLRDFGAIFLVETMDEAIDLANQIAPEHLEILTENPFDDAKRIDHAGAIFIGPYTPEPVGDYLAGPNHTLPTSGTARFSSALSTMDFQKKSSWLYYPQSTLNKQADSIMRLADEEGLTAHANAVRVRLEEGYNET